VRCEQEDDELRRLQAINIILLLLLGILLPHIQLAVPVWASSGNQFGNSQTGTYVDPSFSVLKDGSYEYTTSFGVYDIKPWHGYYVFGLKASADSVEIGWGGFWVLYTTKTDSTWRAAPFTVLTPIGSPVVSPLNDHWQMSWNVTVQGSNVGEVSLIAQFSRTAYPKISVSLNKSCAQWATDAKGMRECALTVWDSIGLKDVRWVWLTIPAAGYDNYKGSAIARSTTMDGTTLATEQQVSFTGIRSWFVDWHELGANTIKFVKVSNYLQVNTPALATLFPMNLLSIDPTFGLTSTGSTSYPTAKAITAKGNAQIDTAQSVFGGASGLFDGTGDYLSLADSADWYFGTGNFTIDFWVRFNAFNALSGSGVAAGIFGQFQDANNQYWMFLYNNSGTYYWHFDEILDGAYPTGPYFVTTITTGQWYHIALVKTGSQYRVFQNGVSLDENQSGNSTMADFAGTLSIGGNSGWTTYMNGSLDEFRISKGLARWTSNFTPPTARYDRDSYTVLLLHNDGTDASTTFLDDVTTGQGLFYKFSLTALGTPTSMSVYSHAAGNMRATIFTDSSGPSSKVCETADTAVSATAWTSPTISGCGSLNAASYWLGLQWNPGTAYAAGPSYTAGSANTGYRLYMAYGAFPSSGAGGTLTAEEYSIYVTYTVGATASLSASGSGSESVVRSLVENRSGSSSGSGTESATVQKVLARSFSDAGSGLVSMLAAISGYRTNSDSGSGQESLARLITSNQASSSSGSGSETISTLKTITRSFTDLGSGLDSLIQQLIFGRSSTETGTGTESVSAQQVLQRLTSEAGTGLESSARLFASGRTPSDTGSGSEVVSIQKILNRGLTDLGSGLEALATILTHGMSLSDQGTGAETLSRLFTGNRAATDTGSGSESMSILKTLQRTMNDLGSGLDAVTRLFTGNRGSTESGSGLESVSAGQVLQRMMSDTGSGLESLIKQVVFGRTATSTGSGSETMSTQATLQKLLAESGTGIEAINIQIVFGRTVTDLGSGLESLTATLTTAISNYVANISDQGTGTVTLSRLFAASRGIFDLGSALEALTHLLTAYVPPSTGGAGGGMIIKPQPSTVMVGAFFPEPRYFLLPSAKMYADITITNPTDQPRVVKVHYTATLVDTLKAIYTGDLTVTISGGSHTYTIPVFVSESGRYIIDITATDGGTATARQEVQVTLWQVWQGPVLLWPIIAFAAAILILFYRRIGEEWY